MRLVVLGWLWLVFDNSGGLPLVNSDGLWLLPLVNGGGWARDGDSLVFVLWNVDSGWDGNSLGLPVFLVDGGSGRLVDGGGDGLGLCSPVLLVDGGGGWLIDGGWDVDGTSIVTGLVLGDGVMDGLGMPLDLVVGDSLGLVISDSLGLLTLLWTVLVVGGEGKVAEECRDDEESRELHCG
jgi:hypothetical protein